MDHEAVTAARQSTHGTRGGKLDGCAGVRAPLVHTVGRADVQGLAGAQQHRRLVEVRHGDRWCVARSVGRCRVGKRIRGHRVVRGRRVAINAKLGASGRRERRCRGHECSEIQVDALSHRPMLTQGQPTASVARLRGCAATAVAWSGAFTVENIAAERGHARATFSMAVRPMPPPAPPAPPLPLRGKSEQSTFRLKGARFVRFGGVGGGVGPHEWAGGRQFGGPGRRWASGSRWRSLRLRVQASSSSSS